MRSKGPVGFGGGEKIDKNVVKRLISRKIYEQEKFHRI